MSKSRLAIFTICSNNYVPMAKILIESAARHHPSAEMFLFIADQLIADEGFYPKTCTVVAADQLPIPNFDSFAFRYDIMEFNTAIKPYCFLYLRSRSFGTMMYFDPDIEIFRRLDAVLDPIEAGASFVLTPHLCEPAPGSGHPSDLTIMLAGVYNLGFLAVGDTPETEPLLQWWARRLEYECINAQERGIFVDQKFMDLMPGFADHACVTRDPSLNVAYWNLHQRPLQRVADQWYVAGRPLSFFHFSGFSPTNRRQLSKHTPNWRGDAITEPLADLLHHYADLLEAHRFGSLPNGLFAYGRFASGRAISLVMRKAFREDHPYWATNPFEDFDDYLTAPSPSPWSGPDGAQITNLMTALWSRQPHLRAAFNPTIPSNATAFIDWWLAHAQPYVEDESWVEDIARRVGARRRPLRSPPAKLEGSRSDVDVIGYLRLALGVGEAGRLTLQALSSTGLQVRGLPTSFKSWSAEIATVHDATFVDKSEAPVQIFNINADQYLLVKEHLATRIRNDAYRIIVPFWELSDFPDVWTGAFDQVDEIWAPTAFIQAAVTRKTKIPVIHMPLALHFPATPPLSRSRFNLPRDKFLFFFAFDFLSFVDRKNPGAIVQAFKQAFRKQGRADEVALVFKTQNAHHLPAAHASFHEALENDPDVFLVEQTLSREDNLGLIASCDAVVSLHRSEGLGLLVAEAMALGKPIIATDYSATKELVTPATGHAVDFKLIPVEAGQYPCHEGQVWADPDIQHAAWQMRRVYAGSDEVKRKVAAARDHLASQYGITAVAARQLSRLRKLGV